jgi:hypothetical protein
MFTNLITQLKTSSTTGLELEARHDIDRFVEKLIEFDAIADAVGQKSGSADILAAKLEILATEAKSLAISAKYAGRYAPVREAISNT